MEVVGVRHDAVASDARYAAVADVRYAEALDELELLVCLHDVAAEGARCEEVVATPDAMAVPVALYELEAQGVPCEVASDVPCESVVPAEMDVLGAGNPGAMVVQFAASLVATGALVVENQDAMDVLVGRRGPCLDVMESHGRRDQLALDSAQQRTK